MGKYKQAATANQYSTKQGAGVEIKFNTCT